jgi:hypothetical protein
VYRFEPNENGCARIVLDEEVVRADRDRELEIAAVIVESACGGVGARLTIRAPVGRERGVQLHSDMRFTSEIRDLIVGLHARLGRPNGAFSVSNGALPWDRPATRVAGDYIDRVWSEAHDGPSWLFNAAIVRVRAKDHALACALFKHSISGMHWETGPWTEDSTETIVVDYGDGAPTCPF